MDKQLNIYTIKEDRKVKLSLKDLIDYAGYHMSESEMLERVSTNRGSHCHCEPGEEEFLLLPNDSNAVKEGGKRYIICMNCGCSSHL